MKFFRVVVPMISLMVVFGCNPLKQMQTLQGSVSQAFNSGDYEQTLASFDQLNKYQSDQGATTDLSYLKMAAQSANALKRYSRAEELLTGWLERSKDEEAVLMLGELYQETGQTDKEQKHWNQYLSLVTSDEAKLEILSRQFALEMKNENYPAALEVCDRMPPTELPELLFMRAEALKATGKEKEADAIVETILEKNPSFEPALLWKGVKVYNQADKWYQSEMTKYNHKPDYTSYVYLRRELKKISSLYRQCRDIFENLREQDPTNKTYIRYLKNIYLRLEMKAEAVKMDMLLNDQK